MKKSRFEYNLKFEQKICIQGHKALYLNLFIFIQILFIIMGRPGRPKLPIRLPGQRGRLLGQKTKKHGISFKRDIFRLNTCMSTGKRIKKTAMELLDSITVQIRKAIAREAGNMVEHSKIQVLGAKSVEAAVKILLPGEMA